MNRSLSVAVTDSTKVGDARREAALLAQETRLSDASAGKLGIIATEAASNLHKHAQHGQIILRALKQHDNAGVEVLAIDRGPGMADLAKCMVDGYSTAGSPGTGLGAISRLSTAFDAYSEPGKGTVLMSRIWNKPLGRSQPAVEFGVICLPLIDNTPCGDAWCVRDQNGRNEILVVDGLGHGIQAAQAADEAVRLFLQHAQETGTSLIQLLHAGLRSTRGAALAVADLDTAARLVRYSGQGNISGTILDQETTRSMVSHNGTIGHELHHVREFQYEWKPASTLVMHSDGLGSRWKLTSYPGLITRHPSVIAGVLYRDFARPKDDVTVLVARAQER